MAVCKQHPELESCASLHPADRSLLSRWSDAELAAVADSFFVAPASAGFINLVLEELERRMEESS